MLNKLEYHYKAYSTNNNLNDPIQVVKKLQNDEDIEIFGFITSLFAYGNVKKIIQISEDILNLMGNRPVQFLRNFNATDFQKKFPDFKYRFYTNNDISKLFLMLQYLLLNKKSIYSIFIENYCRNDINIERGLIGISDEFMKIASIKNFPFTQGLKFMFSSPASGSPCKRMNMFLRWMVRKDRIDFGIWSSISPNKLVIPIDTHIYKISKELNLTSLKSPSWRMAVEITENLKKFSADDPVKYDFALCHIGMSKSKF